MASNVRFASPSTDIAEDAPQHTPTREGGKPRRAPFRPPSGGAGAAAAETYPTRSTDITRNVGFREEDRDEGAMPPKVLSRERRDGHVEEEVVISRDPVHLAADSDGRASGGAAGEGRKGRAGATRERDDLGLRNRNRHEKTTSDNNRQTPSTTTPAETAAKAGGRVSSSSGGRGHVDGNGSVRAEEARIELESGLSGDIAATAAAAGFSHQRSTSRLNEDADTPHRGQSSLQVTTIESSVSLQAAGKGGSSVGSPGTSLKDGEGASGDSGVRSHPPPPACPRYATHQGSLGETGCDGAVSAGAETGEEEAHESFVSSAVPARIGRPKSIAVRVDDDDKDRSGGGYPSGSGRRGGGGSDGNSGRDGNSRSQQQQQQAGFNFADGGLELGGTTATVEAGNSPDIDEVLEAGCGNHGGRAGGCNPFSLAQDMMANPASPYSQALHMILGFVVFVLVAAHKAGDGGVHGRSNVSIGSSGSAGGAGSTSSSSSGRRSSGTSGGRGDSTRRSPSDGVKRRRSGSGSGFTITRPPLLRRLRAAWSKLWHAAEKELATRWRTAGKALAALRQAWSALWVPPPHAEADVLAEALASPPRFRWRAEHGHGSVAMASSGSFDRRRRRRRGSRNTGQHGRGSGRLTASSSSAQDAFAWGDSAAEPCRKLGLRFLSMWGFRPLAGPDGGRGSRSRSPKFLLVLDLDETLVHCSPHPVGPATRRPRGDGSMRNVRPDLKVEIRGGAPSDRPACMYAWKRPHLDVFLGVVSRWYEIAVFTSGRKCYAEVRGGGRWRILGVFRLVCGKFGGKETIWTSVLLVCCCVLVLEKGRDPVTETLSIRLHHEIVQLASAYPCAYYVLHQLFRIGRIYVQVAPCTLDSDNRVFGAGRTL